MKIRTLLTTMFTVAILGTGMAQSAMIGSASLRQFKVEGVETISLDVERGRVEMLELEGRRGDELTLQVRATSALKLLLISPSGRELLSQQVEDRFDYQVNLPEPGRFVIIILWVRGESGEALLRMGRNDRSSDGIITVDQLERIGSLQKSATLGGYPSVSGIQSGNAMSSAKATVGLEKKTGKNRSAQAYSKGSAVGASFPSAPSAAKSGSISSGLTQQGDVMSSAKATVGLEKKTGKNRSAQAYSKGSAVGASFPSAPSAAKSGSISSGLTQQGDVMSSAKATVGLEEKTGKNRSAQAYSKGSAVGASFPIAP